MKVIAVVPVHGRLPLLKYTIERLINKNKVKVICVGDGQKERELCKSLGAEWVAHQNKPLGAKWNACFLKAREFEHDACLFVGSSDWISEDWISEMNMKDFDLVGTLGCHFMHLYKDRIEACYWPGYVGKRQGESIGIGRLISKSILEKIQYQPFDYRLDGSLDYSMIQRVLKAGGKVKTVKTSAKSVSISCDLWINKHNFQHHYTGILPSICIEDASSWADINFPEAKLIFKHG